MLWFTKFKCVIQSLAAVMNCVIVEGLEPVLVLLAKFSLKIL